METFIQVLTEVVASLHHHGFERFLFINGHGGNIPSLGVATVRIKEEVDPTFPYRYGNSTRMDLIGPGYRNMDFSATKNFRINESMGVEFKFESYNATNHPNWNGPNTSLTSTQYGRIISARGMRTNQFALKFNF